MPPKSKRSKKKQEPPVARPEPLVCDEAETSYLWDRIAPIQPNPLDKGATLYTFATNNVVPTGPHPSVVVGYASAVAPLLSPHPPTASPPSTVTGSRSAKHDAARAKELSSGAGDQSAPLSPQASPFSALPRQQPNIFAPQPPRRGNIDGKRAVAKVSAAEAKWQGKQAALNATLGDTAEVSSAIEHEGMELGALIKDLQQAQAAGEEEYRTTTEEQQRALDEQRQAFAVRFARADEDLELLHAKREKVLADLADKSSTLASIAEKNEQLDWLRKNNRVQIEAERAALDQAVQRLKETMVQRLKRTTEEMEQLTQQHREKRQQRAVSESARLVAKLSQLEQRSKRLTATNSRISGAAENTRRDHQLESDRHALLLRKSQTLSKSIRETSGALQGYEKQFAERTMSSVQSEEVVELSKTIDRQYQSILRLKHDLDAVLRSKEEERRRLALLTAHHFAQQRWLAQAEKGNPGHQSLALVASPSHTASSEALKAVTVRAVLDVDRTMRQLSDGARGVQELTDPTELHDLLGYVVQRVRRYRAGVFPSSPKFLPTETSSPDGAAGLLLDRVKAIQEHPPS